MNISAATPLVFVDLETTGTSARHHRVIEIGVVRVEKGEVVARYRTFVDPGVPVPSMITSITGISSAMLVGAPTFDEVALEAAELLDGAVFVAHNAIFDYSFLGEEFRRLGIAFSHPYVCSAKLSRSLFPEHRHHNLDSIIERYGLNAGSRHRALDDADVLWQFFETIRREHGKDMLFEAMQEMLRVRRLPLHIKKEMLTTLPDTPGVYLFYGKDDALLYVGKSRKIRTRVRSHFTADTLSSNGRDMLSEIRRIEHQETAGELGALLLESHLITTRDPAYNKRARARHVYVLAHEATNEDGYRRVLLTQKETVEHKDRADIVGIYKNKTQAKEALAALVREHELCPQLVGITPHTVKPGRPCFARQLGACKGACIKKEKSRTYNRRFREAFDAQRLKEWPFQGPVALEEKEREGKGQLFIVDNWVLLGAFHFEDGEWEEFVPAHFHFHYDTYKLFARELLKRRPRLSVRVLNRHEEAWFKDGGWSVIK